MNKLIKQICVLSGILLLSSSVSFAQGDIDAGKGKSTPCAACHGADGNSLVGTWPKLAAQHEKYIIKQLHDFRAGKDSGRYDPVMSAQAANLSDQDIADLAAYFSAQTRTPGETEKSQLERGQQLYRGGDKDKDISACLACHGPRGLGNSQAWFASLSGQQAAYVEKQLKDYRSGARTNSVNDIMPAIAKHMSDADIKAVASYISGLH